MIACVRLPFFAAAVEARDRPDLAGAALVIGEPPQDPRYVYAVSPLAAQAGVRGGMTLRQAQALCREARVIPATQARYRRALDGLLAQLATFTDYMEAEAAVELRADARRRARVPALGFAQMDDFPATVLYLDLGMLNQEDALHLGAQMNRVIQAEANQPSAVGLASGRFPARVAAMLLQPGELLLVPEGQEATFLADLTVDLLPVDGETLRQLHLLGLHTLGQIAAQPVAALLDRFGKPGRAMHRLANGRDTSPVPPYTPRVTEHAMRTLESPIDNRQTLTHLLATMAGEMAERLRAAGQAARQIELALALEDGTVLARDLALRQPSARPDHLAQAVNELAASLPLTSGVTEIDLTLSQIGQPVARQLSLFDRAPVSQEHLRQSLRDLAARYGEDCFYWVRLADEHARLPERQFTLERIT